MRAYRVKDMIQAEGLNLAITAVDKQAQPAVIISSNDAKRYIKRKYNSFLYPAEYDNGETLEENIANAQADFKDDFLMWKSALDIQRIYDAMSAEYNPVENYNMIEKHTGTDTGLRTPTGWKTTQTQTPDNWKTTETQTPTSWKETTTETPNDWTETETQTPTDWKEKTTQTPTDWLTVTEGDSADNKSHGESSVYGFNSVAPVKSATTDTNSDAKTTVSQTGTYETEVERTGEYETSRTLSGTKDTTTERTGTYETETALSGIMTTETAQTGTMEDKTTYNTTLTRNGNIGVSESSQLAQHEIEFRFKSVAFMLLDQFIKEFCFYVDGCDIVGGVE